MTAPARPARLLLIPAFVLALLAALLAGDPTTAGAAAEDSVTSPTVTKPKGGKGKGKITWDVKAFGPGGSVVAHGKLPGKGKRQVRLQVRTKSAWQTFGKTKSDRKGNFAISAPLEWYGVHKVRATTAGRRPFRKTTKVTVSPAYAPRGAANEYVNNTVEGGIPMGQNPCQKLKYTVNVDDVGQVGLDMVLLSMDQLEYATGVETKFVGLTHELPFRTANPRKVAGKANMIIGWATNAEVSELSGNVGVTRYMSLRASRDGRGKKVATVTDSAIVLSTDLWFSGDYTQGFVGPTPTFAKTVLHELGHAFGLDHPESMDQMMRPGLINRYPDGSFIGRYEAGDLAGLDSRSLSSGCHRPARWNNSRGVLGAVDIS